MKVAPSSTLRRDVVAFYGPDFDFTPHASSRPIGRRSSTWTRSRTVALVGAERDRVANGGGTRLRLQTPSPVIAERETMVQPFRVKCSQ